MTKQNDKAIEKRGTEIDAPQIKLTPEVVTRHINEYASREEIEMFLEICRLWDLNPFKREVYLIKYKRDQPASIVVGYETYLKRAEKSKQWDGLKKGLKYEEDSKGNRVLVAWCEIFRKDWNHPLYHEVWWDEYVQYTSKGNITKFWKKMPRTMLMKVCLSQGFRLAFPAEISGMPYTADEIPAAQEMGDIKYAEPKQEENKEKPQEKPEDEKKSGTKAKGKVKQEKAQSEADTKKKQEKKEEPAAEAEDEEEGPEDEEIVDAEVVDEGDEEENQEEPEDLGLVKAKINEQINRMAELGRDRDKLLTKIIDRLENQYDTHYAEIPGSLDMEAAGFLMELLGESIKIAEEEAG
jgi:phage recombination protein Bet